MPPYQGGGNMIRHVTFEETTYAEPPAKFEAGTPSIGDAVGLGAALDYVNRLGLAKHQRGTSTSCCKYGNRVAVANQGLAADRQSARKKVGVLSFVLPGTGARRTWGVCSTCKGSPSAQDITAHSHRCGVSDWMRRSAHRCRCTTPRKTWIGWRMRSSGFCAAKQQTRTTPCSHDLSAQVVWCNSPRNLDSQGMRSQHHAHAAGIGHSGEFTRPAPTKPAIPSK